MRVHVLGMPHTETTAEWSACAYTSRTMTFASMLHDRGHDVRLYAAQANEARVTEHVPVVFREEQEEWLGPLEQRHREVFNDWDTALPMWQAFNGRAAAAIRERARPHDIVAFTMGAAHRPVNDGLTGLELALVEPGIGYESVWAPFRVFESHAWRHFLASRESPPDLRWYDTVIPRAYEVAEFPAGDGSGEYLLYVGRLIRRKGLQVVADLVKATGLPLKVAGQEAQSWTRDLIVSNDGVEIRGDVEYLGVVGPAERAELMGKAAMVVMPTTYLEPGGGVAIEAQLVGTPVLTVPYGAMTETVEGGVSGFHCSTLAEFVAAAKVAPALDRDAIRARALARFSTEAVGARFDTYFARLDSLWTSDWDAVQPS